MIIGKGSLFLARLTNLSDGASFIIEPSSGKPGETRGVKMCIRDRLKGEPIGKPDDEGYIERGCLLYTSRCV